jgi:hypothetical protein
VDPNRSAPIVLPADEAQLVSIVSAAQQESKNVENDMQRGGVKHRRDQAICTGMASLAVTDWVGTVDQVDSNSDGKGVLAISIAPDISVKTWNNELSDIGSDTLLEPGTAVFEAASAMKQGQLVDFSGTFFRSSDGDCLNEGSMTLQGKVESPEFIFRFSRVSLHDDSRTPEAAPPQSQVVEPNAAAVGASATAPDPAPAPAPAPEILDGTWAPVSQNGKMTNGPIGILKTSIAYGGVSYSLSLVRSLGPNEVAAVAQAFSLPLPQPVSAELYQTNIPMCGEGTKLWMVALLAPGDNSGSGSRMLDLMFLSGEIQPALNAPALNNSTSVCGTYSFQQPPATPSGGNQN